MSDEEARPLTGEDARPLTMDTTYRTRCCGCGSPLAHDGRMWHHAVRPSDYGCYASAHTEHTPDIPVNAECVECGEGEGTNGTRRLLPIPGGRWRHQRPPFCDDARRLAAGRAAGVYRWDKEVA